jgi:hypothetical protein
MKIILLTAFIALIPACGTIPIAERITGTWDLERVVRNGEDVTARHDPQDARYITFLEDGSFVSGGEPVGRNTGRWSLDAGTGELFLDSDAGEDDDSYWFVRVRDSSMTWTGARGFGREFILEHRRGRSRE